MEKNNRLLSLIQSLLVFCIFAVPLFFLPITVNFFSINKQFLFLLITLIGITLWSFSFFINKKIKISLTPALAPLVLLSLSSLLTLLFVKTNQFEAVVNRGSLFLFLPIWYLLLVSSSSSLSFVQRALKTVMISGTMLAIAGVFQVLVLSSLSSLPIWLQSKSFTPIGNPLTLFFFLLISFAITLPMALRQKHQRKRVVLFIFLGIQAAALSLYFFQMLPGKEFSPVLLPLQAGWSIALDALKSPKAFLFGIGFPNFPSLYMQAKPVSMNTTALWNTLPQYSSNEFFHMLTTSGIVGLFSLIWIIAVGLKLSLSSIKNFSTELLSATAALGVIILSFFMIPASLISYFLLITIVALISILKSEEGNKDSQILLDASSSNIDSPFQLLTNKLRRPVASFIPSLAVVLSIIILMTFLYYSSKVYAAEIALREAQIAFAKEDGKTVYEKYILAIQKVPSITSYHSAYSQINLSLAINLSRNENLNDSDRQQISQLMSQAVREARIATSLDPSNATTWTNLGSIFRNLINVAQEADTNAIASYSQAVTLDPMNPVLRVEFGGLYYQLSQLVANVDTKSLTNEQKAQAEQMRINYLQQAIAQFQAAIQLKNDYPNAYYNLAKALEAGNNIGGAYQAMQLVLSSLSSESPDYDKIIGELTELKTKLPEQSSVPQEEPAIEQPKGDSEVAEPSPLPSAIPGGLIELPEESAEPEQPVESSPPEQTP